MVRSLGHAQGPRLLGSLEWLLASGSAAATGALEESWISSSFLYQSREGRVTPRETRMLEVAEGNKHAVEDSQRQCSPAGTVVTG